MSQVLFDALSALYRQPGLDFPALNKELHSLVALGLRQSRLRVIVRFLGILESLTELPEEEETRALIFKGLETLCALTEDRLQNREGANNINYLAVQARRKMQPFFYKGILCNDTFLSRLAWDLHKDAEELRLCLDQNNTKKSLFLIRMIKDDFSFAGMNACSEIAEVAERLQEEAVHEAFSQKNAESLNTFIDFIRQTGDFLTRNRGSAEVLVRYEEQLHKENFKIINKLKKPYQEIDGVILSSEEVNALLDQEQVHQTAFTALPETSEKYGPHSLQELLSLEERKARDEHEDRLIKLAGKLFLKQELLKALVPKEQKILAGDKLAGLEELTKKLKEDLFKNYYLTLKSLLGKELREFVQQEVDRLGKKIKLGLRGENNEILSREGSFVKNLVFRLAGNAISYSIELPERRQALEKTETGRLIVEFDDIGGEFQVTVQDDGRGFNESTMNFEDIQAALEERGGSLEVSGIEGESLKVIARFPMKKLITKSVLCRCGSVYLLMPFRNIRQIIRADSIENPALTKDPACLGQISFSALLGTDKCPGKMALICNAGNNTIVYTTEEILGEVEALAEDSEVPLPPCCDGAVILSGDRIGFLLNERSLYTKSSLLIEKREQSLKALA